jgi:phospholipid/cholesterol/gamma-HCH transport system substrate-binding protein
VREARRNYLLAGTFVLAMLGALIVWLALLTGRTGATDPYHVFFRNVMGIGDGTSVAFQGYPVGQVTGIQPVAEGGFRVDLDVKSGWRIPDIVNVAAGVSERALRPGDRIASEEGGDLFAQMGALADELSSLGRRMQPLLDSLSEELPALAADARSLVARLDVTVVQVQRIVGRSDDEGVGAVVADAGTAAEGLAELSTGLRQTQQKLDALLGRVEGVVEQSAPQIEASLSDLHEALDAAARHAESIAQNLEGTSRNLNEVSGQVRRNPGVLLRGRDAGGEP